MSETEQEEKVCEGGVCGGWGGGGEGDRIAAKEVELSPERRNNAACHINHVSKLININDPHYWS